LSDSANVLYLSLNCLSFFVSLVTNIFFLYLGKRVVLVSNLDCSKLSFRSSVLLFGCSSWSSGYFFCVLLVCCLVLSRILLDFFIVRVFFFVFFLLIFTPL